MKTLGGRTRGDAFCVCSMLERGFAADMSLAKMKDLSTVVKIAREFFSVLCHVISPLVFRLLYKHLAGGLWIQSLDISPSLNCHSSFDQA